MKPVLQALILADHVYVEESGKKIIAGTFNHIIFRRNQPLIEEQELPSGGMQQVMRGGQTIGSPYAYISITDVVSGTELILQFVNITKNQVIFGTKLIVTCENRLQTIEIIAPLPTLPVTEEGTYAFELVCEGEILGSHRILAQEARDTED